MPCENYKDALIEAAATGAVPQGELRAHLAACDSCRAAFAEEQSLFAAIDSGLHTTANDEVPSSLLPRVRAGLDEAAAPRFRWLQQLIFASAGVALALLLFLVARPHRTAFNDQAGQFPPVSVPATPPMKTHQERPPGVRIASTGGTRSHAAPNSTFFCMAASSNPEVLVPPDEREALAQFVATLNKRSDVAAALLAPATEKKDSLVSVDPLQIADVEIKSLEGTETATSDRVDDKR